MAEEDFEIDIYGDTNNDQSEVKGDDDPQTYNGDGNNQEYSEEVRYEEQNQSHGNHEDVNNKAQDQNTHQQGVKRKEAPDDRPVDPGATTAILVSELNWWNTDDEIRGWATQAGCEDELKDITFSEHKVNGKCKG